MKHAKTTGFAAVAAAALAVAPAAAGNPHTEEHASNGNAHGYTHNHTVSTTTDGGATTDVAGGGPKAHNVKYVFKGTYEGAGAVAVKKGNAHVRRDGLTGVSVTFDLSEAKPVVDDTNGDDVTTVDDIVVGDKVLVQARLPKGAPGDPPFAARKLVDQTNPPGDDYQE